MKRSGGLEKLDLDLSRRTDSEGSETEFVLYRGRWMVLFTIVMVRQLSYPEEMVARGRLS